MLSTTFVAQTTMFSAENLPLWERLLEKWGIGFIGLFLFGILAWWTYRREERAQIKRDKIEVESQSERMRLLNENNELTKKLIENSITHTGKLESLIASSIEAETSTRDQLKALVALLSSRHP